MKITKSKLKEMIMQELSGVTAQNKKSVSRKKVNPKNIKDPARPPQPKKVGKGKGIKKADSGDSTANIMKCWQTGGQWKDGGCYYPSKPQSMK